MKLNKELVRELLNKGNSIRKIARDNNISNKTLTYWVHKWDLIGKYNKPIYNENYFSKINTKEKAYILGFILGDGYLIDNNFEITLSKKDISFLQLFQNEIGSNITIDDTYKPKEKRFPRCRTHVKNKSICKDLKMLFGGFKKEDRHVPIIKKSLQKYLVLGFFDAEGCLTFGYRKDRNRFWGKLFITSQLKMLEGIQNILLEWNISSSITKRKTENCYDLYVRTKDLVKICKKLQLDDIQSLERKQEKIKALLRLKSDEFGETT